MPLSRAFLNSMKHCTDVSRLGLINQLAPRVAKPFCSTLQSSRLRLRREAEPVCFVVGLSGRTWFTSSSRCHGRVTSLVSDPNAVTLCSNTGPQPSVWQQRRWRSSFAMAAAVPHDAEVCSTSKACFKGKVGVIGAGQMAQAMIRGWLGVGHSDPSNICTSCRSSSRATLESMGLTVFGPCLPDGAQQVAAFSDTILLGVKPQYMDEILRGLAPHIRPHHLVISIAAGVTLATYEATLPAGTRVIRVMPNTPLLVGQGASAYCLGSAATREDEEVVLGMLGTAGLVMSVEERMMDAVTALSGSGPAYVFMMIEALADGGVLAGLPRDKAMRLAAQTVLGAATMVLQGAPDGSMAHPGVLKDRVASPAGTTIAAINVLEQRGMRGAFIAAVGAAADRSKQLSNSTSPSNPSSPR